MTSGNGNLLAGDIGGTKTDLAIFSVEKGPRAPLAKAEYPSRNYKSLDEMARQFLATTSLSVSRACFDVAGPVAGGKAKTTNLPWTLDEAELAQSLGLESVRLLNDLEATAYAVPNLQPEDLVTLNQGEPADKGAIAVIAPGTGLGEAFLTWNSSRYDAHASEGGHADFAPTDELQIELLMYMRERYEHVSFERVCSGIGLPNIYAFLHDSGHATESPAVAAKLVSADDPTPVIVQAALTTPPCPLCALTASMFTDILAAESGNLALKVLATGGVYLGGGMATHMLPLLRRPRFMQAFVRKGRFAEMLGAMPVHVITAQAALIGTASFGLASL